MLRLFVSSGAAVFLLWSALAHAQEGVRREREEPPPPEPPTLTKAPQLIEAAAPEYPDQALVLGLEASVKVRIHIDATGTVTKVDVVQPVGNGFDQAAVAAVMQYRFEPAEWDGVPGPIIVETGINFVLEQQEVPAPPPPPPPAEQAAQADPAAQGPPAHGGDYRLPVTISGQVRERGTRRRLPGVIVSVAELGVDAVTDEQGDFYFHGVQAGQYTVIAVEDRHDRLDQTLTLEAGDQSLEIRLWMQRKGGSPYGTVVEGEREVLEVTRRTLQRKQLTSVPGTFGDPIRVIQSLPGMARMPFLTGALLIRGSNPDDSGIFLDGHRVPLIFHFLGGPSILNPEFLDSIDLYPGGFPARFGRALGGVVTIESRPSTSDGIHGAADVDILDAGGYMRVPLADGLSLAVAGRRSYLDFVLGALLPEPSQGSTLLVVPVYYDYQARMDYDMKQRGRLSLFLVGSSDELEVLSTDADDEQSLSLNSAVRFVRLIGTYKRPLGAGLTLTISPAVGRDSLVFSSGQVDADTAFTDVDVTQDVLGYRMRVHGRVSPRLVVDAGIDIESRVTRYDVLAAFADDIAAPVAGQVDALPQQQFRNVEILTAGVHADVGWDVTPKLRLVPGLRLDSYVLSGETRTSVDPRLVARYQLDEQWLAKGYVGLFQQASQPEGFDSQFGNPDLLLEKAAHLGVGGEWTPSELWTVDAELYYVDRYDLVHFTSEVRSGPDDTLVPLNFLNQGISDTMGMELMVKREVTDHLYGWLSYTLSRSMQQRGPDADYRPTAFDQRHVLNAVASYTLDSGWEFGGRIQFTTGRPDTPVTGSTFDVDGNGYRPMRGDSRSARAPSFVQVDVRAEKTWTFNYFTLGAYLDVMNVFNFENVEAYQYDYRYRESAPVTSVPFLPTLGIKGKW